MPQYKAPLREIRFLVHNVLDFPAHYAASGHAEVGADLIDPVLEEAARFCENVLAPSYRDGDEIGTHLVDGRVKTPDSYKAAWRGLTEGQWAGISSDPELGGQGLPHSLGMIFHDMAESANQPWCALFTLTQGAVRAIEAHADDSLKQKYLPRMIAGEWTGSMMLTEAHAGSDLGLLRTRAEPADDGSYRITGEKIFITWADQDITDNIIHLVLAKLPDAPAGPKGISLFLVPQVLVDEQGNLGKRNSVSVAKIEEKMGLKSSPTGVINLDGAVGWLVGKPHNGLAAMFTMMNCARLDVAFEGMSLAELSRQGAVEYARERLQMRAPSGAVYPDKPADPIIVHPDVRRMLLTQKALVEGCRMLGYFTAMQLDTSLHGEGEAQQKADQLVALLTPICKGFFTERGSEVADLGIQCFGGHGYIREHGMEQIARDVRITRIYEGTNGIQAIDLMRRKVIGSDRRLLDLLLEQINSFCAANANHQQAGELVGKAAAVAAQWSELTDQLIAGGRLDPALPMSAAFEYMEYSGYACLAWCWAKMAVVAADMLAAGQGDAAFLQSRLETAKFYMARVLPRTESLRASMMAGPETLSGMEDEQFFMP
ncbi:acyl-CoA dehydrogenase C-terminal domain-containing protein [Alcanivorax sp. 1008]|uniref:acyl-CoA dehydrogenase C-terminal domain-containing protein n=1 Tax=Alcanivorax sp. 1008 TaxID=2816853 RepID=UPI001E014893|nr:acyl-CoA dehydrogenase C-terminal domain-containing protein [Alcanivorax sp. 1008]MCC1497982.1 acyl-CoA dehydrogenase C-terminal domain-containing protein [Alcanivorax sp. 1008]